MGKGTSSYICTVLAWAIFCSLSLSLCGCASRSKERTIVYDNDELSGYSEIISEALPSYRAVSKKGNHTALSFLDAGSEVEAFDAQAVPALERGLAGYWYPHYLATVVIAVDRDRTGTPIVSWSDLPAVSETIGYSDRYPDGHFLMAAMAYGLEGAGFTLKKAAGLLERLHGEKRLALRTLDAPIVICYDYQAAGLIRSGRNLEVIVPVEGTLTYQKGLLARRELRFSDEVEPLLLLAGFRLLDGACDDALYPAAADYASAAAVADHAQLNTVLQDASRTFQRNVLNLRHYTSADGREHQLFALIYMILVVAWVAFFVRRAMQKGVQKTVLVTGAVLLGWITVRLIKYQTVNTDAFNRYLWYSYYLFQLALPLVLLWLAWAIDKPEERLELPKWLGVLAGINGMLFTLIFTNDLHNWVFRIDLHNPNWPEDYSYGPAFFLVTVTWALQVIVAVVILIVKSGRGLRKSGIYVSLAFCVFLALYTVGYTTRVPIAWESDYTMTVGLFTLLFVEVFMRSGLVPVNTKYVRLFTNSPLNMQIVDRTGAVALSSAAAGQVDPALLQSALASHPLPVERDQDTLLFATSLVGGSALWQEDISSLNRLHGEIEESVRRLAAANAVLAEEEKIKQALEEERAKVELMVELEKEISVHILRLTAMIEGLDTATAGGRPRETARIALLLCYMKRRSNLFFRERETGALPAAELRACMDELAEMAAHGDVKIAVVSEMESTIPVRQAILFYDFFYAVVDEAVQGAYLHMLTHLGSENRTLALRLFLPEEALHFEPKTDLLAAVAAAGGLFSAKDLEGAAGLSLVFPEGGGAGG